MPKRRRRAELRRAARKVSQEAERVARSTGQSLTKKQQIELAWRERDNPWCCADCDPHHPDILTAQTHEEISAWKSLSYKSAR